MNKAKKAAIIAALCLIAAGLLVCTGTLLVLGLNMSELSVVNVVKENYEIKETVGSVLVSGTSVEVTLTPSKDGKTTVVTEGGDRMRCEVETNGGVLKITQRDRRAWYDYLVIGGDRTQVTVSLPEGAYKELTVHGGTGDVSIPADFSFARAQIALSTGKIVYSAGQTDELTLKTTTGSVTVLNAQVGKLTAEATSGSLNMKDVRSSGEIELKNSTGAVIANGVSCGSFKVSGTTGAVTLKKVVAAGKMAIERSTGAITLERCDGGQIELKTSSGAVTGSLASGKAFDAQSSTGKVSVPAPSGGAPCVIRTGSGRIAITVEEKAAETPGEPTGETPDGQTSETPGEPTGETSDGETSETPDETPDGQTSETPGGEE